MQFKSLKSRITVIFLTLILVVQLAGFIAIHFSIAKNARASVNEQLKVGEQIFNSLLSQNIDNLTQSARILATDYGFRQAIASNDIETIESALSNNSTRIGANIAIFYSPDGVQKGVAGDVPINMAGDKIAKLVEEAQSGLATSGLAIFNNHPYQLVVVPVKAPITIGWIVMGFVIDEKLAYKLQTLSSMDATFLTRIGDGAWVAVASTLTKPEANSVSALTPKALAELGMDSELEINDIDYGTRYVKVFDRDNQTMIAVLQRSISEAIAPYQALQLNLLILTIIGALVFIAGSILTARRIAKPLTELVDIAKQMERGDYSIEITTSRSDEIGDLGHAFNSMREGIAIREQSIRKLAYWDELTQIPNRLFFIEQIERLCENAADDNTSFSILMMDLDRFKQVNDVLGQSAANQLLRVVAERLKSACKGDRDIVSRLGGDEFGILLEGANITVALEISHRLLESLEKPIVLNDQFVDLSAGIGIASFPQHGQNVELLLSRAEMAMYEAKNKQNGAVLYDPSYDVSSQENLSLATELRIAVEENQLSLYVQPKVNLMTGEVIAVEALVRWIHPQRGLIFPDMFIPFAEQTGHVRKISLWMLSEAARYSSIWSAAGVEVAIAINLSARDLIDPDLPNKFAQIMQEYSLLPNAISVEITESSIMDDPVRAQNTVERLSDMGIKLAIDDFGTGYSSLAYLKRLPVDELKIDKSFVLNMEADEEDIKIVRSTIDLGHNLGLKVVAEGIENQNVWNLLQQMGCDYAQGYFMSKPMQAEKFLDWFKQWNLEARAGVEPA